MSEYKIFQPMKYATTKKIEVLKEALASDNYGIELKLDGSSYILAKDMDGSVHLYGDKISKKTGEIIDKIENVPHMKQYAEDNFPNGSQLIVEVTCRYNWTEGRWEARSNSKYVNSIMLSSPAKAIQRQQETELCGAYVFDILFWDGEAYYDKDFAERYEFLKKLESIEYNRNYPWLSFAELVTENKAEKIAEWLAAGEEGGVLKALHSIGKVSAKHAVSEIGSTAKRPMHTTYKIKQVDTVDVVIMDTELPAKAYTGKDPDNYPYRDEEGNPVNRLWALNMINAFTIGLYDGDQLVKIGTVASGLDDTVRTTAFENPNEFIGQVIEVDCMSIDKEGRSLRHPRLMKFRPDKEARHCTMEVVFA